MEWNDALAESSKSSQRGQYKINSPWNGITHRLRVQISRNEISIEFAANVMALHTS